MTFDEAFALLLTFEGTAFTDYKNDAGGETKYGIAKRYHPNVDIANLTMDQAKQIYLDDYWTPAHCEDLPDPLRYLVFDTEVNDGEIESVRILQHAAGLTPDGVYGPMTKEHAPLVNPLIYLNWRLKVYDMIVAEKPEQNVFIQGWRNRVYRLQQMVRNNQLK